MCALLGKDPLAEDRNILAELVTTLPQRLGELGLRSAVRTGATAYRASWADTLPMMMKRCPTAATTLLEKLKKRVLSNASSCAVAAAARATLEHEGYSI